MTYETNNNSGAIFKNDRRENDKQPTHSGNAVIDGKEFWISAWVKEGRNGGKFFSLAFKPKNEGRRPAPVERGGSYSEELDDSEIPF